jgi:hypothetical protein
MGLVFQYLIEFPTLANPPERKEKVDEAFRQFLHTAEFEYMMGALGGTRRTYGYVGRKQSDAVPSDRDLLLEWWKQKPIKAVVRIGPLEQEAPDIDLLSRAWETVVAVDNLTEDDSSQAAAYAEMITKLIQQRAKPHNE